MYNCTVITAPPFLSCVMKQRKVYFRQNYMMESNYYIDSSNINIQLLKTTISARMLHLSKNFATKLYWFHVYHFNVININKDTRQRYKNTHRIYNASTLIAQNIFGNLINMYAVFLPKKQNMIKSMISVLDSAYSKKEYTYIYYNAIDCNVLPTPFGDQYYYSVEIANKYKSFQQDWQLIWEHLHNRTVRMSQRTVGSKAIEHIFLNIRHVAVHTFLVRKDRCKKAQHNFQFYSFIPKIEKSLSKLYKKIKKHVARVVSNDYQFIRQTTLIFETNNIFEMGNRLVADCFLYIRYGPADIESYNSIELIYDTWKKLLQEITQENIEINTTSICKKSDYVLCMVGFLLILK